MFCQRLTCLIKWRSLSCTERSTLMNICRNVLTVSNNSKSSDCNRAWKLQHLSSTSLTLKSNEPRPVIRRPNQVLVQVYASSVNPIDVLLSDGYGNRCFETIHVLDSCREAKISYDRFPLTIGRDFAGVVVATGTNVDHVRVGDRVWGAASPWQSGSHTDLLLTDSCHVGLAPSRIDLEPAASIPYSALTVWSSLGVAQLNASNAMRKR